ncbi:hypothetical protein ACFLV4_03555 [Chloroflexota bacterium]
MEAGDLDDLGKNLTFIIPLILLVLFQIFVKRRKGENTTLEVVGSLLSEINQNQQLMEAFLVNWQAKKFKTGSWERNKNKLDFLDQSLQNALADAFGLAEDFNRQMDSAKQHKSASYLANINVEKLREPLARSKQGLEEWLEANTGQKELLTRRRGLFG